MEALNHTLFLWLNAPAHPGALALAAAHFLAVWLIWAAPLGIGLSWLRGSAGTRRVLLRATLAALLGLLASAVIGAIWPHPRPFAIGLGHVFLAHAPDASFPSDHLTLWWAVAFSLCLRPGPRRVGVTLAPAGLAIAWARIYLGVHTPFDMLGAAAVAAGSAWLAQRAAPIYLELAYRCALRVHRTLLAPWIARGWVRE
jgi:undecaprenyl-diphosphatase